MAQTAHTPGPWSSFNEFGNRGGCFGADKKTLVAHSPAPLVGQDHRTPTAAEAAANFRIIDAALDLLEVAKMCVELSDRWGEQGPLVIAARAAIAKATGSDATNA